MQIFDARLEIDADLIYYRHNGIADSRPGLLFIHGIGESGFCFLEAFHSPLAERFNIVVPDLAGFGLSSAAADNDYSFARQITRLRALLDHLGIGEVHLVGHSMGGDIGTLYCQQYADEALSFVNIEGDLTADNRFLVDQAIQAGKHDRFEDWLRNDFAAIQIVELCHRWPSTVRYLASLNLCHAPAFLASAHEIDLLLRPGAGSTEAPIGLAYQQLSMPRVFCWGRDSLAQTARAFLAETGLRHEAFEDSFHWVMLDQPRKFYRLLCDFLDQQRSR